jgi:hypothetical protein
MTARESAQSMSGGGRRRIVSAQSKKTVCCDHVGEHRKLSVGLFVD